MPQVANINNCRELGESYIQYLIEEDQQRTSITNDTANGYLKFKKNENIKIIFYCL